MGYAPAAAQALREAGAQLANAFVAAELRLIEINPLFLRADGSVAVVVLNRSEQPLAFGLNVDGTCYAAELPARAMATWVRQAAS
jgi:O-glycosyl hydrolase